MAITFVATKRSGLKPDSNLGSVWDAGNVVRMGLSSGAILSFAGSGDQKNKEKVAHGTAGQKCAHKGLIGTTLQAYNKHHNLTLRPDDIWITILTQLCAYSTKSKDLQQRSRRLLCGSQEVTEKLEIAGQGTPETLDSSWFASAILDETSQAMAEHPELEECFLPHFTTTTEQDRLCAAVTFMATVQPSFDYVSHSSCGVPMVTLEGTVEDWESLRFALEKLEYFCVPEEGTTSSPFFQQWLPALRHVCDNLVESARTGSSNNLDFWCNMVRRQEGCDNGCISGWISIFSFFDTFGKALLLDLRMEDVARNQWPSMPIESVNPNVVSCPLLINFAGSPHEGHLFVGQMSFDAHDLVDSADQEKLTDEDVGRKIISPRNDWVLLLHCKPVQFQRCCML